MRFRTQKEHAIAAQWRVSVLKNLSVGATLGRPRILQRKIRSPQGENVVISLRRAIKDRPYKFHCKMKFFDILKRDGTRRLFLRFILWLEDQTH